MESGLRKVCVPLVPMEWEVASADQLLQVARDLLSRAGPPGRVFALTGELGAGKTALVQAFCRLLGVQEEVTSPTFALVNVYAYGGQGKKGFSIFHLDLYRLETLEEAMDIGVEEYLYSDAYCFVEWPELIAGLLPENALRIHLEVLPGGFRKISLLAGGNT